MDALAVARPYIPEELANRTGDNWWALLAIADECGGVWPRSARRTAVAALKRLNVDVDPKQQLLYDLRALFMTSNADRFFSEELCNRLARIEEAPWGEWKNGRPINPIQLARLLRPFNITPQSIRVGHKTLKGYRTEQFDDAFSRYLTNRPVTPSQTARHKARHAAGCDGVTAESTTPSGRRRVRLIEV